MHAYLHTHVATHRHTDTSHIYGNGKRIKYRALWGPTGKCIDAAHIGWQLCGMAGGCDLACQEMIFGGGGVCRNTQLVK